MSRHIRRLILAQGSLQLLNALACVKEYDAAYAPKTVFQDSLLFGGMLAGASTQELVEMGRMIASAYPWETVEDLAPHEESLYRIHKHSPPRAQALLKRLVGGGSFDVVVSARNWQTFNEVCLSTYPEARHLCIGDGFGLMDFLFSPRSASYHEIRQLLPIFDNILPGHASPPSSTTQVIVPRSHILHAIQRVHAVLSVKESLALLPDPSDTVLLLGSSWTESGFMEMNTELEMLLQLADTGSHALLYKPHPRSLATKTERLKTLLRKRTGREPFVLGGVLGRMPIEVLLHNYRPQRTITSHSSSIRNLRYLYPEMETEYFRDDAWLNCFNSRSREHLARLVRDERSMLARIAAWDGQSVLMQRWVDKPGRPVETMRTSQKVPDIDDKGRGQRYLQEATTPHHTEAMAQLRLAKLRVPHSVVPTPASQSDSLLLEERFPQVSFGHNVQVLGQANVHIGAGSCIADNTWLNVCCRDDKTRLRIGTRVLVGRGSMLSAGGLLELGDYCLLAPQVFISDADHVYTNIMRPYMDQGATAGNIVIEENCWVGIHAVITGNITVGRGSVVAANAVVTKDVPPFAVVGGVPARILKLFNFITSTWEVVRDASHCAELLKLREEHLPPPRTVYAAMLRKNSAATTVDPVLAGRGQHL